MRWTKTKKALESLLADAVKDHVQYHSTRYGPGISHYHLRAWVTWDKTELISMSTDVWDHEYHALTGTLRLYDGLWTKPCRPVEDNLTTDEAEELLTSRGIFTQREFLLAADEFLILPIASAIESENPIIRALAMFDRRIGKRRLARINGESENPIVRLFYSYRCQAEGILVPA